MRMCKIHRERHKRKFWTRLTYAHLIDGLKNKKYRNIIVMTGNAITIPGVPNFRTGEAPGPQKSIS